MSADKTTPKQTNLNSWIKEEVDAKAKLRREAPSIWRELQDQIEADLATYVQECPTAFPKVLTFHRDRQSCEILLQTMEGRVELEIRVEFEPMQQCGDKSIPLPFAVVSTRSRKGQDGVPWESPIPQFYITADDRGMPGLQPRPFGSNNFGSIWASKAILKPVLFGWDNLAV